jgi:hypothetical protein
MIDKTYGHLAPGAEAEASRKLHALAAARPEMLREASCQRGQKT